MPGQASCWSRLTGKGPILEFIGESYRFRQRLRQKEGCQQFKARTTQSTEWST
jgi:hypothetical protein